MRKRRRRSGIVAGSDNIESILAQGTIIDLMSKPELMNDLRTRQIHWNQFFLASVSVSSVRH